MKKSILKTVGIVVFSVVSMVSCSSDDNSSGSGNGRGNIDAAIGTFKGKITLMNGPASGQEFFNATIIVTKASNNKLKVEPKSGEAYSGLTPKTIQVYNNTQGILNDGNTPEGTFLYVMSSKSLTVQTQEQAATDVTFTFQGAKE